MSEQVLRPGSRLGAYPEQRDKAAGARRLQTLRQWITPEPRIGGRSFRCFLDHLHRHESGLRERSAAALKRETHRLRQRLYREGIDGDLPAHGFALVREQARRIMGMRHYEVQLFGGWLMLQGRLAEMETGEGKSLTATLPAAVAALAGIPVHVITANDYLARRDAELLRPLYTALGLSVGVVDDATRDPEARRDAWACDITYCTAQQVAFDYLRDGLGRQNHGDPGVSHPLLRGLCFAIVDEADSVLIDEARTPLVIAREIPPSFPPETWHDALAIAAELDRNRDFRIDENQRSVEITAAGIRRIERQAARRTGIWQRPRQRRELARQALIALHLFQRDRDYIVRNGKVEIIDANTGRSMADRTWEMGLHQLIEAREGCAITPPRETLARISYQSFFRRYLRLAGMTGTAREVARELHRVYDLPVVRVPTHRPCRRRMEGRRLVRDQAALNAALITRIRDLRNKGRPVLIGTRSVAFSQTISRALTAAGLQHTLLNAQQDANEAAIIARAGEPGRLTVATNMAGRGTDIKLAPGVAERGGLHVISVECNEARRIDRQLFGRCARQGDPGSFETFLALNDPFLNNMLPVPISLLIKTIQRGKIGSMRTSNRVAGLLVRLAQWQNERRNRRARQRLMQAEANLKEQLAFSGKSE